MKLITLDPNNPEQPFPDPQKALDEPDGLLAVGGCLTPQRLINAYQQGVFPWYNPGEPILWWSPDPRMVLFPEHIRISRSLSKTLRQKKFSVSFDQFFSEVIDGCSAPRQQQTGTWITGAMKQSYYQLHRLGIAHSVEVWHNRRLVGGLYGVSIGQVFFGESMFHTVTDASKVAFVYLINRLVAWGYRLIDCQVHSNHLASLGAEEMTRSDFIKLLNQLCDQPVSEHAWENE